MDLKKNEFNNPSSELLSSILIKTILKVLVYLQKCWITSIEILISKYIQKLKLQSIKAFFNFTKTLLNAYFDLAYLPPSPNLENATFKRVRSNEFK